MKVLNFGSLNLDNVYSVDHILLGGETMSADSVSVFPGGKGMNQSIALAKAGAHVYHAGQVGEDGEPLLSECKKSGVDTRYIRLVPGKTGHTVIQVDKSGQNGILLYGGANTCIDMKYIDEVLEDFDSGDIILLQNEINNIDYIVDAAYKKGMKIILNPSPFDDKLRNVDFGKVYMFLINEVEGEQMTGKSVPEEILSALSEKYDNADIVLTLGSRGCVFQSKGVRTYQDIFKVKAVDTTAAGDTFTGYFIASIIENMPVKDGLGLAAKASAIAVSRNGAAPSIPTREEVEVFKIQDK